MTKEARATIDELRDELARLRKVVDAAIAFREASAGYGEWIKTELAFNEAVDAYLAERGE